MRTTSNRAFTLTELLVVISIIVLLIAVALPAFNAMLYSSESAMAEATLKGSVGAARDAAIRSGAGNDCAAVFLYEPGGRISVVACERVGVLNDQDLGNGGTVRREVFVPLAGFEAATLPKNFTVRGYAPAGSVDKNWYEISNGSGGLRYPLGQAAWVFPETGFYDKTAAQDAGRRQTFMVRFEGGTGLLKASANQAALVVAPRPSTTNRLVTAAWQRVDRASDLRRWALRVLAEPGIPDAVRRQLIGDISGDTALARPVSQLALCDERWLARTLGVRVDKATGCLYQSADAPRFVASANMTAARLSSALEGDVNFNGRIDFPDDVSEAKLLVIDAYTGAMNPVAIPAVGQGSNAAQQEGSVP
ncbi:MAG: prepilin-type N-terminal cleavage/methylation domain-containing protein [Phycisphaerae bacterium]|nr:prepilin-type N-terminal cleavage/methylation domain-containing protein [Phycisphaerae bacterium]